MKPAVPSAASWAVRAERSLVKEGERRGWPAVLLPGHTESHDHKGLVTYKANGRDHFESTSCAGADLTVSKEDPLSSWGALRLSAEKL